MNTKTTHYGSLHRQSCDVEMESQRSVHDDIEDGIDDVGIVWECDAGSLSSELENDRIPLRSHRKATGEGTSTTIAGRVAKMVLPITGVIVGTFLLAWVALPWASVTAPSATGALTRSAGTETPTSFTTDSSSIVVASPCLPKTTASSPFFEHVLEWKEVSASDYASNHTESDESGGSGHHYAAAIEFCSDPDTNSYGYGPVGGCVPGGPAPLIRMRPKTFYHLTLYNNGHIDTNVHTHGLHVSGVGTVDDVTRVAKPGECLTYDYFILDDADVGTFWYHPHRHPLVTTSAYGGAYGMLIVDETVAVNETNGVYPGHLTNFLTQNEVLLQFGSMYNKNLEGAARSNKVNGQDFLDLALTPNTHYYFRVSSVVYAESVNYVEFDPPNACDVRVVSYDGVYRSEIPGPSSLQKHMMTVSSRADFAVTCSENADVHFHQGKLSEASKMVSIRLLQDDGDEEDSNSDENSPTVVSLPASLPSSAYWDPSTKSTWKPRRPYYMPDLSAPTTIVDEYWTVSMDDYFVNGTKGVSVNQAVWDPKKSLRTFAIGTLLEYPIMLSKSHPYHAHINRMQIVEPGGCGGRYEEGEYFDTIVQLNPKTPSGGCTVRTKLFDFAGRVVIHCHRWGHEDKGMMTWIDVLGGHGHGIQAAPATSCAAVL